MPEHGVNLYDLSTGKPITSMIPFSSPLEEYHAAFRDRAHTFLNYYTFQNGQVNRKIITRGEFWDMACSAATLICERRILKGDRIVHCFSSNTLYDLVFRLASIMAGCIPVTINWQADDNERVIYKAKITDAKLLIYDSDFADRVQEIKPDLPNIYFLEVKEVEGHKAINPVTHPVLSYDDEQMIIFTSGTTGKPKGVSLSYHSYLANRLTFEKYLDLPETAQLDLILVNPLHHANSSALADWGMRRGDTIIHLVQRYSSAYWKILVDAVHKKRDLFLASLVARHIDFLQSLHDQSKLPVEESRLKEALSQTEILIGSAPVGPTTVKRILKFSNYLPRVRFGSTETCLHVMGVPTRMLQAEFIEVFEAGWSHRHKDAEIIGYYIGREEFPFTRAKVVSSVDPESKDYFRPCEIGEPGYLITQGANVMSYYIGDAEATEAVLRKGWYTGLRDIVFTLRNKRDGKLDYYWVSRDSTLLIRGGANYAYDQIAAELSKFVTQYFQLNPEQFQLAVVGLRLESEHEDSCCVMIELGEDAANAEPRLQNAFIEKASHSVSKGSRPDYVCFGRIPRNFKGAIIYPQLKRCVSNYLKNSMT
jgi:acyl-CoA synthetase (AMP-forming)/AMP-acid ligase II